MERVMFPVWPKLSVGERATFAPLLCTYVLRSTRFGSGLQSKNRGLAASM